MAKKETDMMGGQMKVIVEDPKVRAEKIRRMEARQAKLDAMKIAQTHIEIQSLKVDAKGARQIADEFLEWLNSEGKTEKTMGLGDAIARVTKKLKIKECAGCGKRREVLNKFRIRKFKI